MYERDVVSAMAWGLLNIYTIEMKENRSQMNQYCIDKMNIIGLWQQIRKMIAYFFFQHLLLLVVTVVFID